MDHSPPSAQYAAGFDQGLFYHYPKYVRKQMTQVLARKVVNYGPASTPAGVTVVQQWNITSRHDSPFVPHSQRHVSFQPSNCKRMTGQSKRPWPGCLPPYSDWSHFTGKAKPWNQNPPPSSFWQLESRTSAPSDMELWWRTFRDLYLEDGIDITDMGISLGTKKDARQKLDALMV